MVSPSDGDRRFANRLPVPHALAVARKACREQTPALGELDADADSATACFREEPDHEYWDREPLEDVEEEDDGVAHRPSRHNNTIGNRDDTRYQ